MLNKEEIEKAKGWLSALDVKSEYEAILKEIILSYIEELEQKNRKKDKIIDEMTNKIFEEGVVWDSKKEVQQYFEKKVGGK